jgi:hypothetical protein
MVSLGSHENKSWIYESRFDTFFGIPIFVDYFRGNPEEPYFVDK